jgi:hypothetical protein
MKVALSRCTEVGRKRSESGEAKGGSNATGGKIEFDQKGGSNATEGKIEFDQNDGRLRGGH